jgi:predicted Zn-dependent protease
MVEVSEAPRSRRLNSRHALLLAVTILVVVAGLVVFRSGRERKSHSLLLEAARRRIERKQFHLALGYLGRYLELHPADIDALDLKAQLLARDVQDEAQALEAIQVHRQVLARDPGRQGTQRRLVELTLKVRGKAQAAATLARDLIRRGHDDAEVHRLLGHALELIAADGNAQALQEALREHQRAEQKEPGDVEGGERLALLFAERFDDPGTGLQILDHLVQANRGSPPKLALVRLARARYFLARHQADRAADEIDQAVQADPTNAAARVAAAEAAIHRGDPEAARQHLRKVSPCAENELQIKLIEALIELAARRPDDAIQSGRAGLLLTRGDDSELTWRLADILLELGKVGEAEPLLSQYYRLIGGDQASPSYRYLRGFALFRIHRFTEAINELEAIRDQVDKRLRPRLYSLLGQCHESMQDLPKALEAYRRSADSSQHCDAPQPER